MAIIKTSRRPSWEVRILLKTAKKKETALVMRHSNKIELVLVLCPRNTLCNLFVGWVGDA